MGDMQSFFLWFLAEIPNFLLSEPIRYFTGVFIGFAVIGLFRRLLRL